MPSINTNAGRAFTAVGPIMAGASAAVIVNPQATSSSLFEWATAQLKALDELLAALSCSENCGIDFDSHTMALYVREFSHQALQVMEAGLARQAEETADAPPPGGESVQ